MIKTVPVSSDSILAALPAGEPVGILGCGECAAALGTGGTKQVDAWETLLHGRNPITFKAVAEAPCDQRLLKRFITMLPGFQRTRTILLLTCPAGTQSLAGLLADIPHPPRLIPGLAAKGLVWLAPGGKTSPGCRFCDDCRFDPNRDSQCPTATCPLQKADGPCQNRDGHLCPQSPGQHCTWLTALPTHNNHADQDSRSDIPAPKSNHPSKERSPA